MKVPFITLENIEMIKKSAPELKKYFSKDNNSWMEKQFGPHFFEETRMNMPEIHLDMSDPEHPEKTDFENVKRIYSGLKFLTDSNASDERIWDALAMGPFYSYVQYRWPENKKEDERGSRVLQKFMFGYGKRRSLIRQAIARLWWIGRLTYDRNRDNPYELTEFICRHSDYIMHILERGFSNNPDIIRQFLQALIDAEKDGLNVNTDTVGELSKYLNILGGTYVLDILPEGEIYNRLMKKIRDLNRNRVEGRLYLRPSR